MIAWLKVLSNLILLTRTLLPIVSTDCAAAKEPIKRDISSVNPIINESAEYSVSSQLSDNITENLINENVIKITGWDLANSRLDIKILETKTTPNIYVINLNNEYSQVDEWKITIICKISWFKTI